MTLLRPAPDAQTLAREVADELCTLIRERHEQGGAVLALPTGATPLPLYRELLQRHHDPAVAVDFSRVRIFGLDEYEGLAPAHPHSLHRYLWQQLLGGLQARGRGLRRENVHLFRGDVTEQEAVRVCAQMEADIREAGGLDCAVLGLGNNGHVAFNEPGTPADARAHRAKLHPRTREDAASSFGGLHRVPLHALTLGLGTLREAKRVRVLVTSPRKRPIVERVLEGEVGTEVPATLLRGHPDLRFHVTLGEELDDTTRGH